MKYPNTTIRVSRHLKAMLTGAMFSLIFLSCQDLETALPADPTHDLATKLGSKSENPFTVSNMTVAIANVSARQVASGRTKALVPSTTHNYVRFAPQDENQLITLHDYGYDLYDVPLDQDIVSSGEYYQDPSLPESSITYQYTLVPANFSLPTTVPYTIVSQVFLFDDDAGDEMDPEQEDPWNPDPPPGGYCYDEYNQAYICGTNPRQYLRIKNQPTKEDLYRNATRDLIEAGLSPREVYNEAMRLAGYPEEVIETSTKGRTQSTRYYPSGFVKVVDNVTNLTEPVRNVKVKVRRFFKIDDTQTDNKGFFYIDKGYRQKASVIIKFTNNRATIRGISGAMRFWEYAQVLEKEVGQFEASALQGMNIVLPFNSNANTYSALHWSAAHSLNTLNQMYDFSSANALPPPHGNLNIWISNSITQGAAAPMLRAITADSQLAQAIAHLWPASAGSVRAILRRWLPDVTLRLNGSGTTTRSASDINGTFFHEYAHTQHYSRAGTGYWASYIWYIVTNGGYGTKNTSGSGRVAVGEAWGNFIGSTFNRLKYLNNAAVRDSETNFLEFQMRNDNIPVFFDGTISQGWIPWGMLHDMTDASEPSFTLISDQVTGYSLSGVFSGFTQSSETVPALRDAILSNNGQSQSIQVHNLTASYGW